jgi:hypothetical protein
MVPRREHRMAGVEKVDVELGDVDALAAKYPDVADDLRSFQQG